MKGIYHQIADPENIKGEATPDQIETIKAALEELAFYTFKDIPSNRTRIMYHNGFIYRFAPNGYITKAKLNHVGEPEKFKRATNPFKAKNKK